MALIDFTLSNARRFYSSMGNPLGVKGLTTSSPKTYVPIKASVPMQRKYKSHVGFPMVYDEKALHRCFIPCHEKKKKKVLYNQCCATMAKFDGTPTNIQRLSCIVIGFI